MILVTLVNIDDFAGRDPDVALSLYTGPALVVPMEEVPKDTFTHHVSGRCIVCNVIMTIDRVVLYRRI